MTTIADNLIKYLKANADKRIKIYYYGDPLTIPISNLPALIIENRMAQVEAGPTGKDDLMGTFAIKLVMNKKNELGKNPEEVSCQRTLTDILMKRTSVNQYEPSSVLGVLRTYFTLGDTIDDQILSIEFFTATRGDLITEEAEIIINIKDFVAVPTRQ